MTTDDPAPVSPLRRPPVHQEAFIRSSVEHTFAVFVDTIGAWWPVRPFSAGRDQVRAITIERRVGGQVYETWRDGTIIAWGRLLVWQPPLRLVMTWDNTPAPTEVELVFSALGPALTRVTVEHRGWEGLNPAELSQDCALPGGYTGGAYSTGWATILARFAAAISAVDATPP